MFTSTTASNTTTTTTTTKDQTKVGQPIRNNRSTLTSQSLRTIASAAASASTSVPTGGGTNSYYTHLKKYHDSVQNVFCYGCDQTKTRIAFSISQLNKTAATKGALKQPGKTGKGVHQPLCKSCTPVEVTTLKCSNCSRTPLLDMFSKSQRRRQRDGCLICEDYRVLLDAEDVIVWSEDNDDDDEEEEEEDRDVSKDDGDDDDDDVGSLYSRGGDDDDSGESLLGCNGFGKMKVDWTVEVEEGDPEWYNDFMNDMFL
ncbi:hypothetical protein BG015_010689 [Linnemannia schmuckeri]|uniref:Stc1 domain-containing protein n=1 Tax=Linnemannia schmuckeri TaxID=64567 RepID=A0A9P5S7J3_9FUNG|nr:hypothetical protein BG015_010689 [Linnemannia schmuckeri]